jgi:leader peptidase (prepilin peptidase)/N-methyltransferase
MLIKLWVIIIALMIGSFLNVVIHRIPRKESVLWPGSHCADCGHNLQAGDLIPVFSYIWLGSRCRYCGQRISLRYPLVELLTVVSFLLIYNKWGLTIAAGVGYIFTALLIISAFIDIEEGIIPDRITYPGMIMGLLLSFYTIGIKSAVIGLILFGGILLGAALLSRGGMGGGDIKLAAVIGAFIGYEGSVITLFLSSLMGGLWAVLLLLMGKATRKTAIRFGPFLSGAAWLVWMYGNEIIDLYSGLFI